MSDMRSTTRGRKQVSVPRRVKVAVGIGVLGTAVAAGVMLVTSSQRTSASGLGHGQPAAGIRDVERVLAYVPQQGRYLGQADAPVTLTEYVDPQSPASRRYATGIFPELVERYVRPGTLRIERRVVAIFDGSDRAVGWAAAASQRDQLFGFTEAFFRNQGHEDEDYVDDRFLGAVASSAGLDATRTATLAEGFRARGIVADDARAFKRAGFDATPVLTLRRSDQGDPGRPTDTSVQALARRIDDLSAYPR